MGSAVFFATASDVRADLSVDALKQLSIEDLLKIEVTSVSRAPEKLSEAASALQVLTQQDIQRSGATSIPEALRLATNLDVARKNAHDWGISARGFNTELANKLLVMIDGRTIYTPLFSGVRWDVQDYLLEDIDRIEIISGPGGTLWGANAVNGVINITTKSADQTQGFYGEAGGGSQLEDFSSVRYGGTLAPDVYYRIYGKFFNRNDEVYTNGTDVGDDARMGQGGFRIDAIKPQGTLTFQGDYYDGTEGLPGAGKGDVSGGNLLGRWSQDLANGSNIGVQLYYDRTHLRQPEAASNFGAAGFFTDDLDTYDLDFQHRIGLGEINHLVWGLGCRLIDDRVNNAPTLGFVPTELRQKLFSGFLQDQVTLRKDLYFTVGTKVEHNDYTGIEWEPSCRLQWNFAENRVIWGAVSRAVRTPSRVDRDIREPSGPFSILAGGADFESETVVAYEAGFRTEIRNNASGSVSLFYNDYSDIRSLRTTPATLFPFVFANDLEGDTYGLELAGDTTVTDWWRLHGGYTLLKEHIHVAPGGVDLNNALNETSDPEQQLAVRSSIDLPRNIQLDANLRWVDVLYNNNSGKVGTVPSYFDLDLRVAIRVAEGVELSLVGQNLLHAHHPEFGVPGPARVEIQRGVYAKLAWRY